MKWTRIKQKIDYELADDVAAEEEAIEFLRRWGIKDSDHNNRFCTNSFFIYKDREGRDNLYAIESRNGTQYTKIFVDNRKNNYSPKDIKEKEISEEEAKDLLEDHSNSSW